MSLLEIISELLPYDQWILEKSSLSFYGMLAEGVNDILNGAIGVLTDFLLISSDPNHYMDVNQYMPISFAVAFFFLLLNLYRLAIDSASSSKMKYTIGLLAERGTKAIVLMFALPFVLFEIYGWLADLIVKTLSTYGDAVDPALLEKALDSYFSTSLYANSRFSAWVILIMVVYMVSAICMGFASGKRHIELIICFLVAPLSGQAYICGDDSVAAWNIETIAVMFSSVLHVFMLKLSITALSLDNMAVSCILTLCCAAVSVAGPSVGKKFLYKTGVGSGVISGASAVGRMAVLRAVIK